MYTLLIPLDDSMDRAMAQADAVAAMPGHDELQAVLIHVIQGAERDAPAAMRTPGRVETVRRTRERLEEAGVDTEVREASAPPADGILELAADVDADGIVMGGRKRSPAGKVLFGSVTQAVILDADIPVTVTGAGRKRE